MKSTGRFRRLPSRSAGQFAVFIAVGALTTLLYLGMFAFLADFLDISYRIATSIAYPTAVAYHYLMSYYVTFRPSRTTHIASLHRYGGLVLINYFITFAVLEISVSIFRVPPTLGAAVGIVATLAVTYLLSKYWVFADRSSATQEPRPDTSEK